MKDNKNYLTEAFQALKDLDLNEDVFEITDAGIEDASDFAKANEVEDFEDIIDPLAQTEEELQDSYLGKAILDCEVCHSKLYKDPEEVVIDEEAQLANLEEACPYCQSNEGFKVIGQVAEYCPHCEDGEDHKDSELEIETEEETEVKDEEEIDESIKSKRGIARLRSVKESSKRDDIDADADDKKERARSKFAKAEDDADADRDYKLKKKDLKESDKPAATSIEDAQKWVDYDMKKYGKISGRTNRLVKKAGFQIIKDDHGDYEVTAGKFESLKEAVPSTREIIDSIHSNEDGPYFYISNNDALNILRDQDLLELLMDKFDELGISYEEYEDVLASHMDSDRLAFKLANALYNGSIDESLKENVERVDIETESDKVTMEQDENGKVVVTTEPKEATGVEATDEVIAPVEPETEEKFEVQSEEDFEDVDFDEFEETDFDSLGEKYLKRVYENVKSFKTTQGSLKGNKLQLEGLITFKSGKEAKTTFMFEAHTISKTGKLKFLGENKQFAKGKKSFTLTGSKQGNKLMMESLTYNYRGKDASTNKSQRLYGRVSR